MPNDLAKYQVIDLRPALGAHMEKEFVGGGGPGSLKGPWEYYLRYPSEPEVQNAVLYLLEKLGELGRSAR